MDNNEDKGCTKVKFATEKDAVFYIDKLKKTSVREKKPLRAYLCPFCISWHLTSREDYDTPHKNVVKWYTTQIESKNKTIVIQKNTIKELKETINDLHHKIKILKKGYSNDQLSNLLNPNQHDKNKKQGPKK